MGSCDERERHWQPEPLYIPALGPEPRPRRDGEVTERREDDDRVGSYVTVIDLA